MVWPAVSLGMKTCLAFDPILNLRDIKEDRCGPSASNSSRFVSRFSGTRLFRLLSQILAITRLEGQVEPVDGRASVAAIGSRSIEEPG